MRITTYLVKYLRKLIQMWDIKDLYCRPSELSQVGRQSNKDDQSFGKNDLYLIKTLKSSDVSAEKLKRYLVFLKTTADQNNNKLGN